MNTKPTRIEQESPARRLEILYVASLTSIALLLTFSQVFILWELSTQKGTLSVIGSSIRQRSLDHSLILSALAVSGGGDRRAGVEEVDALRKEISHCKRDALKESRSAAGAGGFRAEG